MHYYTPVRVAPSDILPVVDRPRKSTPAFQGGRRMS